LCDSLHGFEQSARRAAALDVSRGRRRITVARNTAGQALHRR
jgi:hypothetical protein